VSSAVLSIERDSMFSVGDRGSDEYSEEGGF
jgi:hypothetical protein